MKAKPMLAKYGKYFIRRSIAPDPEHDQQQACDAPQNRPRDSQFAESHSGFLEKGS
jgi:hypothetical protein